MTLTHLAFGLSTYLSIYLSIHCSLCIQNTNPWSIKQFANIFASLKFVFKTIWLFPLSEQTSSLLFLQFCYISYSHVGDKFSFLIPIHSPLLIQFPFASIAFTSTFIQLPKLHKDHHSVALICIISSYYPLSVYKISLLFLILIYYFSSASFMINLVRWLTI